MRWRFTAQIISEWSCYAAFSRVHSLNRLFQSVRIKNPQPVVALTRACDLLLLPRQSERVQNDWFSLLNADLTQLPIFDAAALARPATAGADEGANGQDQATWEAEAAVIAATRHSIVWQSPSRHDGRAGEEPGLSDEGVFVGEGALSESIPAETQRDDERIAVKGGRERGLVVHKLLEEVLTRVSATPCSADL